jgi:tetratricopeptide (TPR) repeat protein
MVLDNADDMNVLFDRNLVPLHQKSSIRKPLERFIPRSRQGHLLITTRDARVGKALVEEDLPVVVPSLSKEDAKAVFRSHIKGIAWDERAAEEIVTILDCLPLAITQAAANIRFNTLTIAEYLEQLAESDDDLTCVLSDDQLDSRRDFESRHSIMPAWKISFDQIQKTDRRAAELLSAMALLDNNSLPEMMLRVPGERQSTFKAALGTLLAFDFITAERDSKSYVMHKLVQLSIQQWLDDQGTKDVAAVRALNMISRVFPNGQAEYWETCKLLFPHAIAIQGCQFKARDDVLKLARLQYQMAWYEWQRGWFDFARTRCLEVRDIQGPLLTEMDLDVQDTQQLLGEILYSLGRYKEVEAVLKDVVEKRESALGSEDQNTLQCLNLLGRVYRSLGKYKEAEAVLRGVVIARSKMSDRIDPTAIASKADLALALQFQGKYDASEGLAQEALDQSTLLSGPEHPNTLHCADVLATTFRRHGKYEESLAMSTKVFEGREKLLGAKHINTLNSLNNLAIVHKYMGHMGIAEGMFRQALEGFGSHALTHPAAFVVAGGLSGVLRDQKRYDEAIEIARQTLQRREQSMPPGHPHILISLAALGRVLELAGKPAEAEPYILQVVAAREAELGPEAPDTLSSQFLHARILRQKGELAPAEAKFRRVIQASERVLRKNHPTTITRIADLAALLADQRRYREAHDLMIKAVQGTRATPGTEHKVAERQDLADRWRERMIAMTEDAPDTPDTLGPSDESPV